MYICREKNLAFLAHPHTASRSIAKALQTVGFKQARGHHEGPPDKDDRWDLDYFCVVRNHFDAFTSWYLGVGGSHIPHTLTDVWVSEWVQRHIQRRPPAYCRPHRLWYFLVDLPKRGIYPYHLCYEGIENNLNEFLSTYDIGAVSLPNISNRKRKGATYQNTLHWSARKWIEIYFDEELREFGYFYEEKQPFNRLTTDMNEGELTRSLAKWID